MLATSLILTTGNHHCTSDTWYLNHDQGHHCAHPQRVRITDDSFMWRTHVIFPWRFLGLEGLTSKELRQVCQGSEFFFQGLLAAAWSICYGSIFLSKHPWKAEDTQKVSIWTSPWIEMLLQLPQVRLHRVSQWRWGLPVSKPTGILTINCPRFATSVYKRQIPNLQKPQQSATSDVTAVQVNSRPRL